MGSNLLCFLKKYFVFYFVFNIIELGDKDIIYLLENLFVFDIVLIYLISIIFFEFEKILF